MNDTPYVRSPELASRDDSRLLIVDVQERLLPHILHGERVVENCRKLLEGSKILGVPAFATEQYPKGLGRTVPALAGHFASMPEKLRFSSAECLGWPMAAQAGDGRHRVVVAGIETHVCVQQTALDLIAQGYRVIVPADAVGSRSELDWKFALDRLTISGAVVTTTESILFEWCEVAGTDEFKAISRLVTGRA